MKIKIEIPCPYCGYQIFEGLTKTGQKVKIEICRCSDGSDEFDVTITSEGSDTNYEKHQCSEEDIADCISSRFDLELDTMTHKCF